MTAVVTVVFTSCPTRGGQQRNQFRGKQQQTPHGLVMRMLNYILLIANLNIAYIDLSNTSLRAR